MKATHIQTNFIKWLSPDEMHSASQEWLSVLHFMNNEQSFIDKLIKSYTLQLMDSKHADASKIIISELYKMRKETKTLINRVKAHDNALKIMVDGIDQLKQEEAYKKEHHILTETLSEFLETYKKFKLKFYKVIKQIIKEQKLKYLVE